MDLIDKAKQLNLSHFTVHDFVDEIERLRNEMKELNLLRTQVRDLRLQRDEEAKRLDYLDSLTKRTHEMRKKEYPVNSDMHFAKHVSLYLRNEYGHVVKEGYGSVREAIDMAMRE